MAIQVGDKIPAATLKTPDMKDLTTADLFGGKKVVLFAVPGAFTPGCSKTHLPGYIAEAEAIKEVRQSAVDIAVSAAEKLITEKADEKVTGEMFESSIAELKKRLN